MRAQFPNSRQRGNQQHSSSSSSSSTASPCASSSSSFPSSSVPRGVPVPHAQYPNPRYLPAPATTHQHIVFNTTSAAANLDAVFENRASHNRNDAHRARRDLHSAVAGLNSSLGDLAGGPATTTTGQQQQQQASATTTLLGAQQATTTVGQQLPGTEGRNQWTAGLLSASTTHSDWNKPQQHQQQQGALLFHGCGGQDPSSVGCTPVDPGSQLTGSDMGGGSSKLGYKFQKDNQQKKRHAKSLSYANGRNNSQSHKIVVQQASAPSAAAILAGGHNENHHNALTDSPRQPIAEQLATKPGVDFTQFKVIKLKAAIDKKPTTIDEKSSAVLKYRTPHFRALATVEVPVLEDNQSVQVGWIQTCTEMRFVNTYNDEGVTSWEFPEIVTGKYQMIGDADGKQYPWYGSKNELNCVTGPTKEPTHVTVHMNDNFFPQVTWYIPDHEYDKTPRLTHIHRAQRFYTYLVAQDLSGGQRYHILRVVEWAMELHIDVNPHAPLGKRAKLLGPTDQVQPRTIPSNLVPLQPYALKPPNANNAQTLVWRPFKGMPKIIVPPLETTMDMEKYIQTTRALDMTSTRPSAGRL